jgi:hypothetical protein
VKNELCTAEEVRCLVIHPLLNLASKNGWKMSCAADLCLENLMVNGSQRSQRLEFRIESFSIVSQAAANLVDVNNFADKEFSILTRFRTSILFISP